jgi:hypothetical protein
MEVEQMMACLLEEMRTNQAKADTNLKLIKEDIKTNQEMLAKLEANQERMMAQMDSQLEKMEACLGKMEATDLEANPGETRVRGSACGGPEIRDHGENCQSTEEAALGLAPSHKVPQLAEEMDPGQWWVPEEVGRCLQKDGPLHSIRDMSYRTNGQTEMTKKTRHRQCCKMNPDRRDVQEETSGATRMQQWNKGQRLKGAAMSEKREDIRQDLQEGSRAEYCEVKSQTFSQN